MSAYSVADTEGDHNACRNISHVGYGFALPSVKEIRIAPCYAWQGAQQGLPSGDVLLESGGCVESCRNNVMLSLSKNRALL